MKNRPLSLIFVAFVQICIGPLFVGYLYLQNTSVQTMSLLLNWQSILVFVCSVIVAIGLWRVRIWGYLLYLTFSAALIGYVAYQFIKHPVAANYLLVVISAAVAGCFAAVLQKHISAPYFNPALRWWERARRVRVQLTAKLLVHNRLHQGEVLDISTSGCFAHLEQMDLQPGDVVAMQLDVLEYCLKTQAKVIWRRNDLGGYGLMFVGQDRTRTRNIKNMISYLVSTSNGNIVDQGVPVA